MATAEEIMKMRQNNEETMRRLREEQEKREEMEIEMEMTRQRLEEERIEVIE